MTINFNVQAGGKLSGTFSLPGDKSISHRAIMLGSLAEGQTTITGFLRGEDSLNTLKAFQAMGVEIIDQNDVLTINGVGLSGLKLPQKALYLGNSGTSMRLLAGLLAGQSFDVILEGDQSLSRRPMRRVTEPLSQMGADIKTQDNGSAPLCIQGGTELSGIEYRLPVASAQIKSCLLLAGLYAKGQTCIIEPGITRDHTERMLKAFSYPVSISKEGSGTRVCVKGGSVLKASHIDIPADISSAAFFMVAASIASNSNILLSNVNINPTRIGVLEILRLMGANITLHKEREVSGEPVADIEISSANLKGIEIPENLVPLAIDEFPVLFIAAACAEGKTILRGAEELRVKESDRIQAMAEGLACLGVNVKTYPDGIEIEGCSDEQVFKAGKVHSYDDHRIAMAFSVAGLRAMGDITIADCDNVNTSFPGFIELMSKAGLSIQSF